VPDGVLRLDNEVDVVAALDGDDLKELEENVEDSEHEESSGDELDNSASEDAGREIWTLVDNVDRNLAAGNDDTVRDIVDATVDNADRNLAAGNGDTVGDIFYATVDNGNQILAAGSDDTGEDSGDAAGNSDDDVNMGSGDSGNNEDGDEVTVIVEPVRRSARTTNGRNSNPNRYLKQKCSIKQW
jgi:hypothetical protein